MKDWPKVWNFVISHGILSILPPKLYQICIFFLVTTRKLSSNLESLHFPTFSANCRECKTRERNGHGKVIDKYFDLRSVKVINKFWITVFACC